jgi:hypothetical protein
MAERKIITDTSSGVRATFPSKGKALKCIMQTFSSLVVMFASYNPIFYSLIDVFLGGVRG